MSSPTPTIRRVLGVDPGSIRTGWGIVEPAGSRFVHVASGTIQCGRGDFHERLDTIYRELAAVCATHQPVEGAIEALFHQRNADSALKLGHARGVALLAMHHAGLRIAEYAPSYVRKSVVGYGAADKTQTRGMVAMLLGSTKLGGMDESDALSIAMCHLNQNIALRQLVR